MGRKISLIEFRALAELRYRIRLFLRESDASARAVGLEPQQYLMLLAIRGLPEGVPRSADLPDGSHQTSASGPMYRGPGAPANGPMHHYTFEIYALDTKLDVPVGADAFETRAAVMKAMQGHIVGKAVYMGLFRRPQ